MPQTPVKIPGAPGETVYVSVGAKWATGLHQVDNPVFDAQGNLFVTYSGSRGQEAPVSIFRVTRDGTREPFASGIVNATSMAIGPDRQLYVSSRFEGAVYRVSDEGKHELVVSELGVACGLAFDRNGDLYVGDRSGTIFRVRDNHAEPFATLPASVAAFHLAISPEGELFASGPTLSTYDHVYRIGERSRSWRPRRALVTGAGPVGLLASLAGVERGLEVHVFDRAVSGIKPQLVRDLPAIYHPGITDFGAIRPDIVIECTGAGPVIVDSVEHSAPGGIVCLAGLSGGGHTIDLDVSLLNRETCWRTTSCSARSMPTAVTTKQRPRCSRPPTLHGLRASSRVACHCRAGRKPSNECPTTSKS